MRPEDWLAIAKIATVAFFAVAAVLLGHSLTLLVAEFPLP